MGRWIRTGTVLAAGLALGGTSVRAQVVERERDVSITGPRGKTVNRSITTERGPGFVDRQVNATRPGGTFHSNAFAGRAVPGPGPGPRPGGWFGPGWRPGGWGPGPREVIINNGGGGGGGWLAPLAVGGGLFGLGMVAGSAISSNNAGPAPQPVPVQPVYAAPPTQVYVPPQPYGSAPAPAQTLAPQQPQAVQGQTVVIDPVADAIGRLQSYHANSRRDGAYTLGQLRDPRAIPSLVDRLKNDLDPDVRIACATALGEIGDPRVAVYLERVTIYDKKQKVKDAASLALSRLPREVPGQPQQGNPALMSAAPGQQGTAVPNLAPIPSNVQQASSPYQSQPIDQVPPPPTPAYPSTGAGNP